MNDANPGRRHDSDHVRGQPLDALHLEPGQRSLPAVEPNRLTDALTAWTGSTPAATADPAPGAARRVADPHMIRVVAAGPDSASFIVQRIYRPIREVGVSQTGRRLPRAAGPGRRFARSCRGQWPTTRTSQFGWIDAWRRSWRSTRLSRRGGHRRPWAAGLKPGDDVLFAGPGGAYAPAADATGTCLPGTRARCRDQCGAGGDPGRDAARASSSRRCRRGIGVDLARYGRDHCCIGTGPMPGRPTFSYRASAELEFLPGAVQVFRHGEAAPVRASVAPASAGRARRR